MEQNLRPNDKRARNAIISIWVVAAVDLISVVSNYFQYSLLSSVQNGETISMDAANSNDTRQVIIGVLYGVVYIIAAVTFIQWFRRAYFNLHLKVSHLQNSEGWAAGAWFVPFVNLYKPFQIMKELFVETKTLLFKNGISSAENLNKSIVGIWWTFWIIASLSGQISFRISRNAEEIDELVNSTIFDMATSLLIIPLAFLAVKMIQEYSKVEPLLNQMNDDDRSNIEKELM